MTTPPTFRSLRFPFAFACGVLILGAAGCGSSVPATGTQVNVTIPKEEADKQNAAYREYMKKGKSAAPAGASQDQMDRMKSMKR